MDKNKISRNEVTVLKHDIKSIPQYAVLSMLLEATCRNKPGNVDRGHDFDDLFLHQFVASSVSTFPAWYMACDVKVGLGEVIHRAVEQTQKWQGGGNTHIGTVLLNAPLARAFSLGGANWEGELEGVLDSTTPQDAVLLYRAVNLAPVRLAGVGKGEPDVTQPASMDKLTSRELNIRDVMRMAENRDLVASEWSLGFPLCRGAASDMREMLGGDSSDAAITRTYLQLLSSQPDTLVIAGHGKEIADEVMREAKDVLDGNRDVEEFDAALLSRSINPGTTADLTAAACFITLFEEGPGWI
jgi:triphosphoribosyl-dephospho-CoA synthase